MCLQSTNEYSLYSLYIYYLPHKQSAFLVAKKLRNRLYVIIISVLNCIGGDENMPISEEIIKKVAKDTGVSIDELTITNI